MCSSYHAATSDDQQAARRLVGDIEHELNALDDVCADANLGTRRNARGGG